MIQEWREQNGRFTPKALEHESEEEVVKFDFLENRQRNDDATKQKEKEIVEQRMAQLKVMGEQLEKLTLLNNEKENE